MTVAAMVAAQFREHAIACPRARVRLGEAVMGLGVIARVTVTLDILGPQVLQADFNLTSQEPEAIC